MEYVISIAAGISLAAACGFRVFVPLLILSITSMLGYSELTADEQWIGTTPALIAFSVATALEIAAYYIPWVDNAFDLLATPLAAIAGVIAMGAFMTDFNPILGWTIAAITGGGAATAIQLITVKARGLSSGFTGGLGNFIVSTGELIFSFFISVVAIFLPVFGFVLLLLVVYFIIRQIGRLKARNNEAVIT